ncbi:hypothetical protein NPIL_321721 [Nephila pilipes]|uniref:Uncharacterized protein n=1 Tax=Nephila pilipes TaxID=299642 RepID=A0A8X6QT15_NEPPI|nr:hypothetical protein NPIL_321721 [Nephila pilipes]
MPHHKRTPTIPRSNAAVRTETSALLLRPAIAPLRLPYARPRPTPPAAVPFTGKLRHCYRHTTALARQRLSMQARRNASSQSPYQTNCGLRWLMEKIIKLDLVHKMCKNELPMELFYDMCGINLIYHYEILDRIREPFKRKNPRQKNNDIQILVKVKYPEVIVMSHKPLYSGMDIFSYIGGLMGYWLGISVWACTGIAETTFWTVAYYLKQFGRKSRHSQPTRPQPLFRRSHKTTLVC